MQSINIIGTGRVGTTLGFLLHKHQIFTPNGYVNRHEKKAQTLQQWTGQGDALSQIHDLKPADVTLITVTDDNLLLVAEQLAQSQILRPNDIVFHCSGALSSLHLREKLGPDVLTASVHPIFCFAEPRKFDLNCYCTIEGDEKAQSILKPAFQAIGANLVTIKPEQKLTYHTATVMVSNYLIGLMQTALSQLQRIGIEEKIGLEMIQPLVMQSVDDLFKKGPHAALTGPVSRGDWQLVKQELDDLKQNNKMHAELYRLLGNMCLTLVKDKKTVATSPDRMEQILG